MMIFILWKKVIKWKYFAFISFCYSLSSDCRHIVWEQAQVGCTTGSVLEQSTLTWCHLEVDCPLFWWTNISPHVSVPCQSVETISLWTWDDLWRSLGSWVQWNLSLWHHLPHEPLSSLTDLERKAVVGKLLKCQKNYRGNMMWKELLHTITWLKGHSNYQTTLLEDILFNKWSTPNPRTLLFSPKDGLINEIQVYSRSVQKKYFSVFLMT